MKKSVQLVSVLLLLMASSAAMGQAQFSIGLKAGPNFAKINTDESAGENYKNRTGFHGGAFALIKVGKIGVQPEIIFSQQGSKFQYSGSPDLKSNFSYMNIPIIIKLYTIAGINLQLGPQFGFLTKAETESYNVLNGSVTKEDIKGDLKKSDVSLAIGAGWDLPFGLSIDGRYNLGLSKINDTAGSEAAKNQVWQLSLGYKLFKIGKK
ncbi:MAG: porin family protein [Bacteroidota bacterium]